MLRYIYVFFVGLFVAIFLGTGIAVFYPAPKAPTAPVWYDRSEKVQLTTDERAQELAYIARERAYLADLSVYNRNVSMLALAFAVIILAVTLTMSERLGVVADGLLLGGVFTLLYGIGRGMATDSNQYRFIVASIGLAVTIMLGYVKLSRPEGHPRIRA